MRWNRAVFFSLYTRPDSHTEGLWGWLQFSVTFLNVEVLFINYGQWLCFGFCNQEYFYVGLDPKSYAVGIMMSSRHFPWQWKGMAPELMSTLYHFLLKIVSLPWSGLLGKKLVAHNDRTLRRGCRGEDPDNTSWSCGRGIQAGGEYQP